MQVNDEFLWKGAFTKSGGNPSYTFKNLCVIY